jgi:hypothetical protein
MAYHQFNNGDELEFGSFETFQTLPKGATDTNQYWYWWACFAGCLPDGDPSGPFKNELEAIADANDYA